MYEVAAVDGSGALFHEQTRKMECDTYYKHLIFILF